MVWLLPAHLNAYCLYVVYDLPYPFSSQEDIVEHLPHTRQKKKLKENDEIHILLAYIVLCERLAMGVVSWDRATPQKCRISQHCEAESEENDVYCSKWSHRQQEKNPHGSTLEVDISSIIVCGKTDPQKVSKHA